MSRGVIDRQLLTLLDISCGEEYHSASIFDPAPKRPWTTRIAPHTAAGVAVLRLTALHLTTRVYVASTADGAAPLYVSFATACSDVLPAVAVQSMLPARLLELQHDVLLTVVVE